MPFFYMKFEKIIFVYNANSGALTAVGHSLHKLISPDTYSCSLCKFTHGFFGEKKAWSDFVGSLEGDVVFYHKDEFLRKYPNFQVKSFPLVLLEKDGELEELIGEGELALISSLEELIMTLKNSLL